jgi:hypothetical protein
LNVEAVDEVVEADVQPQVDVAHHLVQLLHESGPRSRIYTHEPHVTRFAVTCL